MKSEWKLRRRVTREKEVKQERHPFIYNACSKDFLIRGQEHQKCNSGVGHGAMVVRVIFSRNCSLQVSVVDMIPCTHIALLTDPANHPLVQTPLTHAALPSLCRLCCHRDHHYHHHAGQLKRDIHIHAISLVHLATYHLHQSPYSNLLALKDIISYRRPYPFWGIPTASLDYYTQHLNGHFLCLHLRLLLHFRT